MKEERMAVLSMLERGIITAAEAERLLLALRKENNGNSKKVKLNKEEIGAGVSDAMNKAGDAIGTITKKVGEKAEEVVKEAQPFLSKVASTVNEKVGETKEFIKTYQQQKEQKKKEKDDVVADPEDFEKNETKDEDNSAEDKGFYSPEEFKKIAFSEDLDLKEGEEIGDGLLSPEMKEIFEDETEEVYDPELKKFFQIEDEEDDKVCDQEKTCCSRNQKDCPRKQPCCWEDSETIDWEEIWGKADKKDENPKDQ